jgi:hypothetical protein
VLPKRVMKIGSFVNPGKENDVREVKGVKKVDAKL